jgi:hypothetical protein
VSAVNIAAHIDDAVIFLELFLGDALWPLVAIRGRDVKAYTFPNSPKRQSTATEWIGRHNRDGYNIYFAPNPLNRLLHRKATKDDVAAVVWLWVDLDPPKTAKAEEIEAWRTEMRQQFRECLPCGLPPPTCIVDSGRGFWVFWRLGTPLPVDGRNGPATIRIEAYGHRIEQAFTPWADNCRNIERIARLPGTVNQKTSWVAGVVDYNPDAIYALEDFPPPEPEPKDEERPKSSSDRIDLDELPARLRDRILARPIHEGADVRAVARDRRC